MKNLLSSLFILIFCLSVYGQEKIESETRPKLSDKAIVYFYSLSAITTLVRVNKPVFLDDKEIADIRPEKYFIVLLEPGTHTFRMKKKKIGGIEMNFQAGQTYYIRVNWATGNIVRPVSLSRIETESGAYDIKQLQPVKPENITDKSRVFTELPK
ncbi:MAG TPA: DUF2846 domain-containing protein [Pyrinomonadaceae bacterium]